MKANEKLNSLYEYVKSSNEFKKYTELLLEWNKKFNLTAITEPREVDTKHHVDSLSVFLTNIETNAKVIDIGTGAGFPGIPMKLYRKDLEILLLDSLKKRIGFLDTVIKELKLDNIETIHGRAEELGRNQDYREKYDIAISRAVANLRTLAEYSLPFVKPGGKFIAMKGPEPQQEINESKNAIKILGGKYLETIKVEFDDYEHNLIVIKKIAPTANKYPRAGGKPKNRPL
ncbi:MAG: 16S rRNA (guanine(527)-N(7))-methyltransferase RsmG [Tissierellia bacterium]|nr:16S rRNA (guanine(527)-N(7))-methyltransferase RsmG [Tissierellia bacterium]